MITIKRPFKLLEIFHFINSLEVEDTNRQNEHSLRILPVCYGHQSFNVDIHVLGIY